MNRFLSTVANFLRNEDGWVTTAITAGASLLSAALGRKSKVSTKVDYNHIRKGAEAAGFNPVTALLAGGSANATTTSSSPINSAQFVFDAFQQIASGVEEYQRRNTKDIRLAALQTPQDRTRQQVNALAANAYAPRTQESYLAEIDRVRQDQSPRSRQTILDRANEQWPVILPSGEFGRVRRGTMETLELAPWATLTGEQYEEIFGEVVGGGVGIVAAGAMQQWNRDAIPTTASNRAGWWGMTRDTARAVADMSIAERNNGLNPAPLQQLPDWWTTRPGLQPQTRRRSGGRNAGRP